jgi:hypothetical protein
MKYDVGYKFFVHVRSLFSLLKVFIKNGYWSFHDKSCDETWNRKNVPQHNKGYIRQAYRQHYSKWGKVKPFPLKSGRRQGFALTTFLFNIVSEFLTRAIK